MNAEIQDTTVKDEAVGEAAEKDKAPVPVGVARGFSERAFRVAKGLVNQGFNEQDAKIYDLDKLEDITGIPKKHLYTDVGNLRKHGFLAKVKGSDGQRLILGDATVVAKPGLKTAYFGAKGTYDIGKKVNLNELLDIPAVEETLPAAATLPLVETAATVIERKIAELRAAVDQHLHANDDVKQKIEDEIHGKEREIRRINAEIEDLRRQLNEIEAKAKRDVASTNDDIAALERTAKLLAE